MKLQIKSESVTPFAGISFIDEMFEKHGINNLINNELGFRSGSKTSPKGFSYSDILNHIFYCGGDCAKIAKIHLPFKF